MAKCSQGSFLSALTSTAPATFTHIPGSAGNTLYVSARVIPKTIREGGIPAIPRFPSRKVRHLQKAETDPGGVQLQNLPLPHPLVSYPPALGVVGHSEKVSQHRGPMLALGNLVARVANSSLRLSFCELHSIVHSFT